MTSAGKNFDAMSSQEKCDVVANAASELAYSFYYEQDREGLDLLVKTLKAQLLVMQDCVACLNFINSTCGRNDISARLDLLMDFIDNTTDLGEEAVEKLEQVAERARTRLEDADVTLADEAQAVRNIKQIMQQHVNEYEAECRQKEMQNYVLLGESYSHSQNDAEE